eukprot:403369822
MKNNKYIHQRLLIVPHFLFPHILEISIIFFYNRFHINGKNIWIYSKDHKKCRFIRLPYRSLIQEKIKLSNSFWRGCTILSRLGILIFLLVLANNIINRQRKVTSKQKYSNLYNKNYFTLNQTNFDIAVGVQFYDGQSHLDIKNELHTYMKFIIDYQEMKYMADNNGSYYVKREIVPYELVPCTNDRFLGLDSQMSSLGINKPGWYCPKDFVMFLQGKIESSDKRMMRVRVFPCQNSTTPLSNNRSQNSQTICKPYEEIYRVMSKTTINVAFINSYFDEDEFAKSPVKHEVKQFFYNFDFNQSYAKLMYIQKSNVITKDSWISSLFGYQNYEFYSVGHIDNTIGIIKPSLFEMFQIIIYQGNYEVFVESKLQLYLEIHMQSICSASLLSIIIQENIQNIEGFKHQKAQQQPRNLQIK